MLSNPPCKFPVNIVTRTLLTMAIVPADVMFGIDDVEDQGLYSTPFVYIHCRFMAGSLKG